MPRCLFVAVALATLTFATLSGVRAEETTAPESSKPASSAPPEVARRFSIRPFLSAGLGLESLTVGEAVSSEGEIEDVKVEVGGGLGGGIGFRFGVTRRIEIEAGYSVHETTEWPPVEDADAAMSRSVVFVTILGRVHAKGRSLFPLGAGVGRYLSPSLEVSGFGNAEVDYADASGYHVSAGWEFQSRPKLSFGVELRAYFVDYEAERMLLNGVPRDDLVTPDGKSLERLSGDGVDLVLFLSWAPRD